MKKNLFFAIVSLALLACSCSSALNLSAPNLSAPKFTSTDKLLQVQPGNSYDVVVQTLGCEPYNLLSNQKDGYLVCVYKYKLVEREFKADAADAVLNQRGGETAGMEVYNPTVQDAYLVFKDNKLESIVTSYGLDKVTPLVLFNNTLYKITKETVPYQNYDSYINIIEMNVNKPAGTNEAPGIALPFMSKGKKE